MAAGSGPATSPALLAELTHGARAGLQARQTKSNHSATSVNMPRLNVWLLTVAAALVVVAKGEDSVWNLEDFWLAYPSDAPAIAKCPHYLELYTRHFQHLQRRVLEGGEDPVFLEIGVDQGGSLQMFRKFFGPRATIFGIDIDPRCQAAGAAANATVFIGDQASRTFLQQVKFDIEQRVGKGRVDVILDDGGHKMSQQMASLQELFELVRVDGGLYVVEDLHTSMWEEYGPPSDTWTPGNFLFEVKKMVDELHAHHRRPPAPSRFTRTVFGLHVYDSLVVIERGPHPLPRFTRRGDQRALQRDRASQVDAQNALPVPAFSKPKSPPPRHRPQFPCDYHGNLDVQWARPGQTVRAISMPVHLDAVRSAHEFCVEMTQQFQELCEKVRPAERGEPVVQCTARMLDASLASVVEVCGEERSPEQSKHLQMTGMAG